MITLTFRNLWSHKRRLVATVLAVALGVAFLSGTLVLGDTMRGTFKTLFEQSNAGTDVVIQTRAIETGTHTERGQVDEALVARVRDVAGVADVAPVVEGYGRIIGRDGKPVGGMGPPTVAGSWAPDPFNPYRLVDGRAPQADDEVVLNRGAATAAGLQVGDTATVETPSPVPVRVVGIATFGDADSAGGLTYAGFTLAGAQRHVLGRTGEVTSVVAAAEPGVGQLGLRDRLAPLAPAGTEVLTGAELTARQQQGINEDFLDFLTVFLTVFAGVAVAVAAFGISNTFTILVTQRRRESALVRSLGATRRQVLAATIVEALVVGLVASALGVIAGVGLAVVLKAAFAGLGMTVPAIGLVVQPYVLAVGLAVGVLVTLAAAVLPARRAARVAPLEALRDAAGEPVGVGRWRVGLGLAALVAGLAVTVAGSRAAALGPTAAGAALTIVAAVVLGPVVALWLGPVVGAPLRLGRGVTGELATENARRNPRRTAATAAALMIGVAVVTLFTAFGSSLRASLDASIARSFGGDLVVTAGGMGGSSGFSPQAGRDIAALPEVRAAAGLGIGGAFLDGQPQRIGIGDPGPFQQVLDVGVVAGSMPDLGADELAVSQSWAAARGLGLGDQVSLQFVDGSTQAYRIGAVYTGSDVAGDVVMSRAAWATHASQDLDTVVLVRLADGVSVADGRVAVERAVTPYAGIDVQDREQYLESVGQAINQVLTLVYVLLVLAIVIALMGIANTLALSIHERTRELGLLRAVGQTRAQVRRMVRGESVIIATLGTLLGLGLGVFLAWALVGAASSAALPAVFRLDAAQLLVVLVAGAAAGLLASWRAARRAASLDVLDAIATA